MASAELDPLLILSSDYLNLFMTGHAFSDVTFSVQGRHVHAHRCILAARSKFFRLLFFDQDSMTQLGACSHLTRFAAGSSAAGRFSTIPVEVVGYEVFMTILRFLYSGQLVMESVQAGSSCQNRDCTHTHCSFGVDLCLDIIHAAKFFGVDHLSDLVQRRLASVLESTSVDNLMRVLVVAKKQKLQNLWPICSELVIKSGMSSEVLRRYLPRDVLGDLAEIRSQKGYGTIPFCLSTRESSVCEGQRTIRLQQALDCMDVELVRLMVMGEGLNLDKAHALHYSVANCNREVVKALLELGVVDVNYANGIGRTALHLAAEMGSADMIAVLLDHHADPNSHTEEGLTALDILRCAGKNQEAAKADEGEAALLCKEEQKRILLCIELLQSAAAVAGREEGESSCVTETAAQRYNTRTAFGEMVFEDDPGILDRSNNIYFSKIALHHSYNSLDQQIISYGALNSPASANNPALTDSLDGSLFSAYPACHLSINPDIGQTLPYSRIT